MRIYKQRNDMKKDVISTDNINHYFLCRPTILQLQCFRCFEMHSSFITFLVKRILNPTLYLCSIGKFTLILKIFSKINKIKQSQLFCQHRNMTHQNVNLPNSLALFNFSVTV